ncbi:MAG: hypothetical protein ACOYT4_01005 [Nanoarchaeota archaeon]
MKINFKKIATVIGSTLLIGATAGFAAAASTYPTPFVQGGNANFALVVGKNAALSDAVAGINIGQGLSNLVSTKTTGTTTTVTGEAVELFSGGTKIYVNDSLNQVKTVLTKSNLPSVLADQTFSGNVDATITQTIELGSNPKITFKKHPTSSDDPEFALETSTSTTNYMYNATATFNKAVNMTHADSEGETITLFGQKFTIASATDTSDLVLLKSAEKLSLDSENPTGEVTVSGNKYTVELVSASDSAATIKVTDSAGVSEQKEVNEAASKKINGVTIAVITADETNLKLSASIIAGSEKITMTSGSAITVGEQNTVIDGTKATFIGGTGALTKLVVSVAAPNSDADAVKPGTSFVDPVFGSFKLDFTSLNIPEVSTSRENIVVRSNGDDKMDVTFSDYRGKEATVTWAKNTSTQLQLMHDDDGRNITVFEKEILRYQDYVVVGNQQEGYLLKLYAVKNSTTGTNNDYAKFQDIFSGDVYETVWTSDGVGTVSIGGKSYDVTLSGNSENASEDYTVRLGYPDSSGNNAVIYPTIETNKGAKFAFYEPKTVQLDSWDGSSVLAGLKFPDGDGYEDITVTSVGNDSNGLYANEWNITDGSTVTTLSTENAADSVVVSIGQLSYNITATATANQSIVYLQTVAGGENIKNPAIILFNEKDDNNNYEALIIELEPGTTGDDGLGVDSVEDTWSNALSAWKSTLASDSKKEKRGDLWGDIILVDSSDSDQKSATISYPDEQIYALLYMAEEAASITAGTDSSTSTTAVNVVPIYDDEISSVQDKNLIVVGGSCINTVAAKLLGATAPICGADFTAKTNVGAGQYLIQAFNSPYTTGKIAMLVAGYEAADTTKAAQYVRGNAFNTDIGTKLIGTSATEATVVTESSSTSTETSTSTA